MKYKFDFKCQSVNYNSDEHGMMEVKLTYAYFLLKVLDLFDTVIWAMTFSL